MGSISPRLHIKWGSDAASEPTSTLVLTSPGRFFVDIRVLRSVLDESRTSSRDAGSPLQLSPEQLDWAIGGTSTSIDLPTQPDGTTASRSTFHHWVSNRTLDADAVADVGDMFPQPDGTTLETGSMVNPATGLNTTYEELWDDQEPQPVPGLPACTVLRQHDDANHTRGLFVQVAQHAQGVLRRGNIFTAERWLWDRESSRWEHLFRVGDPQADSLHDLVPALNTQFHKGQQMEVPSGTWSVIEV
ncbi:hypothetical protein BD289DRAFT_460340 [Coniella lustricola]|uniref:Protein HRI1 n=1 Tax=Coniella lustricola TaxID=2025994 RepID=A0A2T3AAN4_9PEZI|nr:hypothetical protein BD289DRAFT_460340 [Coniella lustricola]